MGFVVDGLRGQQILIPYGLKIAMVLQKRNLNDMPDLTDRYDYCAMQFPAGWLEDDGQGGLICKQCKARAERFAPQSNVDVEERE
jgi:hypothetical protein